MLIRISRICLLLPLVLVTFSANGIVDMENIHLGKSEEGVSGRFELSAYSSSGNTEKEEASLGSKLEWVKDSDTVFGVVNYSYGKNQDETNIDKGFVHLRYINQFHNVLASEVFLQADRDKFRRLTYRGIAGAGLRSTLYEQDDRGAIFFGTGLFYEKEVLHRDDNTAEETINETGRGNIYLILKFRFSESTTLISSTYYQPNLRYSVDYRASESASLIVAINKSLALKLSAGVTHDSEPPEDVERTDVTYKTSLIYQF